VEFEFLDLVDFGGVAFQWKLMERKVVALLGDLVIEDVEVCLKQLKHVSHIFHMKIHYYDYHHDVYR